MGPPHQQRRTGRRTGTPGPAGVPQPFRTTPLPPRERGGVPQLIRSLAEATPEATLVGLTSLAGHHDVLGWAQATAAVLAEAGNPVLVVDCTAPSQGPGLADVVGGQARLLDMLTTGSRLFDRSSPIQLLQAGRDLEAALAGMGRLVTELPAWAAAVLVALPPWRRRGVAGAGRYLEVVLGWLDPLPLSNGGTAAGPAAVVTLLEAEPVDLRLPPVRTDAPPRTPAGQPPAPASAPGPEPRTQPAATQPALPAGRRPALPSGQRPALCAPEWPVAHLPSRLLRPDPSGRRAPSGREADADDGSAGRGGAGPAR